MTPLLLAILLFTIGSVLLVAELVIPAHGVTAGTGLLALLSGVIACFFVSQWLGVGVLAFSATAGPVLGAGWVHYFTRTRLGRRFVLPPAGRIDPEREARRAPVRIGQIGITVSALRPGGVCAFAHAEDFSEARLPAVSDFGPVPAGQRVRVVAFSDGRATVRAV